MVVRLESMGISPAFTAATLGDRTDPLDMLTPERVSELLKVPVSTVYALCRERRIPHVRVGRRIVFDRAALTAWVAGELVVPR